MTLGCLARRFRSLFRAPSPPPPPQELEDILETYFAQLDRTCARLRALEEHVAQTEDYVNIDLARPP